MSQTGSYQDKPHGTDPLEEGEDMTEDGLQEQDASNAEAAAPAGEALAQTAAARIQELEEKLSETTDRALRALAEADNVRKRTVRERQDTAKFAISTFARDLLEVSDNLRRALAAITPEQRAENTALDTIFTGVEATERALLRVMEANGIVPIVAQGKIFDPNLHEVMFESESAEHPPGTILHVIDPGYMIHERLLRPARVGIAKGEKPNAEHLDEEV